MLYCFFFDYFNSFFFFFQAEDGIRDADVTGVQTCALPIYIKNKKWADDFSPIDTMGHTWVDLEYSKAYLRHLFIADEYLGKQIATIHNLGFYMWLVREARQQILAGTFYVWKEKMVRQMEIGRASCRERV